MFTIIWKLLIFNSLQYDDVNCAFDQISVFGRVFIWYGKKFRFSKIWRTGWLTKPRINHEIFSVWTCKRSRAMPIENFDETFCIYRTNSDIVRTLIQTHQSHQTNQLISPGRMYNNSWNTLYIIDSISYASEVTDPKSFMLQL